MSDMPYVPSHVEIRRMSSHCLLVDHRTSAVDALHPSHALALALLTVTRDRAALDYVVGHTYRMLPDRAAAFTDNVFERARAFLTSDPSQAGGTRYDPRSFVYATDVEEPGRMLPLSVPATVNLVVTRECNFSCQYCFFRHDHRPAVAMPTATVLSVVEQAADMGVAALSIAGGEPFLHPATLTAVRMARHANMAVVISTNGSRLSEAEMVSLADAGLLAIQVSLDAPTPEMHDLITNSKGTFHRVVGTARRAKDLGMWLRMQAVATPVNAALMGRTIDVMVDCGADEVIVTLEATGMSPLELPSWALDEPPLWRNQILEAVEARQACHPTTKISISDGDAPWEPAGNFVACGVPFSGMTIHPSGEVGVCEMIEGVKDFCLGNVNGTPLVDIWLGSQHRAILRSCMDTEQIDQRCAGCPQLAPCRTGCFLRSKLYSGNYFAADPRCQRLDLGPAS